MNISHQLKELYKKALSEKKKNEKETKKLLKDIKKAIDEKRVYIDFLVENAPNNFLNLKTRIKGKQNGIAFYYNAAPGIDSLKLSFNPMNSLLTNLVETPIFIVDIKEFIEGNYSRLEVLRGIRAEMACLDDMLIDAYKKYLNGTKIN